jgi:hypothetical protein
VIAWRMTVRRFATGLFALALVLLSAAPASAGDYTVHTCKEESGTPVYPVDGWRPIGSVTAETIGEACFRGGSLFARLPGRSYRVGTYVGWRFDAPAGTEIVGYRISRSATVGKPSTGNAAPVFYVAWPALAASDIRERCFQPACSALGRRDRAVPENIIGPRAPMAGVRALHFVAQCGGTAGGTCLDADSPPGTDTVRLDIHAARVTLRDLAAPAVGALSGPLAERGRTHRGTTTVTARATDAGAGVVSFTLEVDGRAVTSAAAPGCAAAPYTSPTPCPTDIAQTLELDTTTLGHGRHTARVVARDASGNATPSPSIALRVDNRRRAAYAASVGFGYRAGRRGTRFTRLSAKRVPRGASIRLTCSGGRKRGCPFKRKRVVRSARKATHALLPALERRLLRPKARLEVRITAADGSVQRRRFAIRRGKAPKRTGRCRAGDAGARFRACP